ncbi:hypothetical protein QQP08_012180 [Theobroma cacao]|nr:hypothetical protein QQP08_012180 [Theobroma cacao]
MLDSVELLSIDFRLKIRGEEEGSKLGNSSSEGWIYDGGKVPKGTVLVLELNVNIHGKSNCMHSPKVGDSGQNINEKSGRYACG